MDSVGLLARLGELWIYAFEILLTAAMYSLQNLSSLQAA